jgi:hypothetical protein
MEAAVVGAILAVAEAVILEALAGIIVAGVISVAAGMVRERVGTRTRQKSSIQNI